MLGVLIMAPIYVFWGKGGSSWFIPVLHLAGALAAIMSIFVAILYLQESLDERRFNKLAEIVSSGTQQPLKALNGAVQSHAAMAFLHKRYDYDLFRNRAADLVGGLLLWTEIGFALIAIVAYFYPVYEWWSAEPGAAGDLAFVWISPAILILMPIVLALINFATSLIFGRWPGEAKWFHKQLRPLIENQKAAAS